MLGEVGEGCWYRGRSGSGLLMVVLACLFIAVGLLMGIIFSEVISREISELLGRKNTRVAVRTQPPAQEAEVDEGRGLTQLADQLGKRVTDACLQLQALISLVTVIVALIGIGLGVSIWRTERYAERLIRSQLDSEFRDFKKTELEPLLAGNRKELTEIHATYLENFLETYRNAWDANSLILCKMDESFLESSGLTDEEKSNTLKKRTEERETLQMLTYCKACLIPKVEDIVVNAAQHLGAMGGRAKDALPDLHKMLDRWPAGRARMTILRAIDKIRTEIKKEGSKVSQP